MTFEYFNTKFHCARCKQKQSSTFWYCVDNFYPWKDIVGKKVSKLRSIAELRAFYGICISPFTDNYEHLPVYPYVIRNISPFLLYISPCTQKEFRAINPLYTSAQRTDRNMCQFSLVCSTLPLNKNMYLDSCLFVTTYRPELPVKSYTVCMFCIIASQWREYLPAYSECSDVYKFSARSRDESRDHNVENSPKQWAIFLIYERWKVFEECTTEARGAFKEPPPQSTYRGRDEIGGSESALSVGAFTITLYVMVDGVKGGGRTPSPPPHPHQPGLIFPWWWNLRHKATMATLCELCGRHPPRNFGYIVRLFFMFVIFSYRIEADARCVQIFHRIECSHINTRYVPTMD